MARSEIPMVINLRQNKNAENAAYGKYFAEVDAKEPLNLKGLAKHMTEHNKVSTYEMTVLVLGEMVKCMVHLLKEGQPVKLDGFGTFSPSLECQGNGKESVEAAVAAGADNLINGVRINFNPENTKGEKLTSRALKADCLFEFGYLVESEKRTVNGKERRFQKKTALSYLLAPEGDGSTGGGESGGGDNGGGESGGGNETIPSSGGNG